jgi:hypothetical protein
VSNRIRFGVRVPFFRNAGVLVFRKVSPANTQRFSELVDLVRLLLNEQGQSSDSIVFEVTPS